MAPADAGSRLTFQEAMELVSLPSTGQTKRYMSVRAAWLPGSDILGMKELTGDVTKVFPRIPVAAFGGHVYAQAGLAVSRTVAEEERHKAANPRQKRLGLHTIHGYFTTMGHCDRPFVYEVTLDFNGKAFTTAHVCARQPLTASIPPDHYRVSDASKPLGPVCFTAILSFMHPQPHSGGISTQAPSAWTVFAPILRQRKPMEWPPSPRVDMELLLAVVGNDESGTFPMVDMRKVDMTAYNAGRPPHEQRELILYRLLAPLPTRNQDGSENGWGANAHPLVHAYEADRNGLLMLCNHLAFGFANRVASLSYSFVVHCNVDEAVMEYGEDQWWLQEWSFPRFAAARGLIVSNIWNPTGVHVATAYQDGLVTVPKEGLSRGPEKEKL